MAIQFNCPYCTAPIKVGDDAAGKIGKCPKCETKLRVPQPARPETPAGAPARAPETPSGASPGRLLESAATDTAWPTDLTEPPAAAAPLPFPIAAPAAETSYARQVRQRRQGSWGALLLPLLMGGVLVALAAGYWWYARDTMTGAMTGERLPQGTALHGRIPVALAGTSREIYIDAVKGLQANPAVINSDLLQVEFRGGPYGLETWLTAGAQADLVRVSVRQNKLVAQFNSQHAAELIAARDTEMQEAAAKFIADWQNATRDGMVLGNTLEFRDSLGLNSLLGGLGYHSAALVGNTYYPCVHEDEEGRLYFAVPSGTTTFVVTERMLEGQDSVFPQEYRFDVTVEQPAAPQPVAEEPAPAEPEADESAPVEGEASPEMSPESGEPDMDAPERTTDSSSPQ
jgi:hypothetical protein